MVVRGKWLENLRNVPVQSAEDPRLRLEGCIRLLPPQAPKSRRPRDPYIHFKLPSTVRPHHFLQTPAPS